MIETIQTTYFPEQKVLLNQINPKYAHHFINPFLEFLNLDLKKEFKLKVQIRDKPKPKINPILKLAKPEDAEIIAEIVKEDYEGSYPYKEMEDPQEIRKMISSGNYKFMLFVNEENMVVGSTCFVLDFKEKKGYIRTFVVRKKYLGILDATKAYVGSSLLIFNKYKKEILIWWAELRTADAKAQYINQLCSLKPIAFLPNKDKFYNQIESDLVSISYNKKIFKYYRSKERPKIIPSVTYSFKYSQARYNLNHAEIVPSKIKCNQNNNIIKKLFTHLKIKKIKHKFNYITYKLTFEDSDSYFKFLYTPQVNNFEKTEYKVKNCVELFVFLQLFKKLACKLHIRYMEAYVSAYKPLDQKLFRDAGLIPRGYIPAWKLDDKKEFFEDYIVFNYYEGKLNGNTKNIEFIPEGKLLLKYLYNLYI
jgi:hypothetical protein